MNYLSFCSFKSIIYLTGDANEKVLTIVLDGFGYREEKHGNAVWDADPKTFLIYGINILILCCGQVKSLLDFYQVNLEIVKLDI